MLSRIARAAFVTTKPSILYSGLLSAHRRSLATEGNESSSKTTNPVGGWIKSDLENIHTDIRGLFATDKPELLEIARYYFDGSGKSIRPLLICAMARLVNRQLDEANGRLDARQRQIALIAEMIHVSSLIHDDIIDHSELRRGRASVNARWGAPKAVLAGDYILAVASRALAQLGDAQVVETLSRVLEDLVKGELMQFGTKEDENERFEHYTTKTYRKTASLIANSCKAVAILAQTQLPSESTTTTKKKENEALCELSYECGRHIGIAFQLIDDVLDFTSHSNKLGKPGHGADLRLGLATAPVLFAAARHPQLNSMIMRRFGEEGDVARAFELVLDSNGIAETRFLAAKYCENAERLLDTKLRPSHEIDYLKFIIRSVINRDK